MSQENSNKNKSSEEKMRPAGMGGGMRGLTRAGEKPKNFKETLKKLLNYLKPQYGAISAVIVFACFSTLFTIFSPKVMGKATNKLFEGFMAKMQHAPDASFDFSYILIIVLTLIGLYLISSLFTYLQQYLMAGVSQKIVYNMRKDVNEKLNKLPIKYFDTKTHGEIMSRVTNDIDTISNSLQQSMTQLISAVITLVGIIIMMLSISPLLTVITFVTIPLSLLVTVVTAKRSQKYFSGQQKSLGELNGHVEEMYSNHNIVKAFGREKKSINEFDTINDRLYSYGWRSQFISGIIMPCLNFVGNLGYVAICVIGGILVSKRVINIGDIQAFIQYSKQFTQPIVQTANIANIIQSTIAAAERVFEVLEETEEIPDLEKSESIKNPLGAVKFENVSFSYKEDQTLIEDLSIDVKPGQTIAIVGPTGSGKTTLVNLLMRFYELKSGKISVDGIDITKLKRQELHKLFGMVLQDTWLFNGTMEENIGYGKETYSEQEIKNAAYIAHADRFIRTLPEGYKTVINEESSNISQGQKQLLTIARAILADPKILILDEATSSVDTRTEVLIQKAMLQLMKGRTSFVIAHRLSTIKEADCILVMDKGHIIEKGTHKELLQKGGFYFNLYNSQFAEA